jgi:polyisoprenoid-binding protein YceI
VKTPVQRFLLAVLLQLASTAQAGEYLIDTSSAQASVNFKFDYLGVGRITGVFRKFGGSFFYDPEKLDLAGVNVIIGTASLDSNHTIRDHIIRSSLFLGVKQFPTAEFISNSVAETGSAKLHIFGELTLHGVTRKIELQGRKLGEINDERGRHRVGFEAAVTLNTLDFDMRFPPSNRVLMELYIEGVRKP